MTGALRTCTMLRMSERQTEPIVSPERVAQIKRWSEERCSPWVSAARAISVYGPGGAEGLTQKGGLEWRGPATVVEVPRDGAPPLHVNCPGSEARCVSAQPSVAPDGGRVGCGACAGMGGLHATDCVPMLSAAELARASMSDDRVAGEVARRADDQARHTWLQPGTLMPLKDPPKHSPDGYCAACDWLYCRVREVKAEPVARCAGCSAPTTQAAGDFQGGAVFAFPVQTQMAASYLRWNREEEKHLCQPCAKKVAEFIAHLKATHGGRR